MGNKANLWFATSIVAFGAILISASASAQNVDRNLNLAIKAARDMRFPGPINVPDNRAYILEKFLFTPAEVALIFGYADNRTACEQIAEVMTRTLRAGTFRCHPVQKN